MRLRLPQELKQEEVCAAFLAGAVVTFENITNGKAQCNTQEGVIYEIMDAIEVAAETMMEAPEEERKEIADNMRSLVELLTNR